jgi:hypothetical protein
VFRERKQYVRMSTFIMCILLNCGHVSSDKLRLHRMNALQLKQTITRLQQAIQKSLHDTVIKWQIRHINIDFGCDAILPSKATILYFRIFME